MEAKLSINDDLEQKYIALKTNLEAMGNVAVAFSGGVDSTLLLKIASEVLGKNCCAITVNAQVTPKRELLAATSLCRQFGVEQHVLNIDAFTIDGFCQNSENRCYVCKKTLFTQMTSKASELGFLHIADGTNTSDLSDFRPGLKALKELSVKSPLKMANMSKADVRELSKAKKLETWNKPSYACLATRIAYSERITTEKLKAAEAAEEKLMEAGFLQVRCRVHETCAGKLLARIEVEPSCRVALIEALSAPKLRNQIEACGFQWVCVCAKGYGNA